jgi:hypothetical protein
LQKGHFSLATTLPPILETPCLKKYVNFQFVVPKLLESARVAAAATSATGARELSNLGFDSTIGAKFTIYI